MTLATAAQLVRAAADAGRATPAFNVIALDQAEAVVAGAEDAGVPVLLQLSENAIRYRRGFAPILAACRELATAAGVPVGLHLDHLENRALTRELIARGPELGVGSLMFDAAALPYEENIAATAEVAVAAHARGLWVEGELGEIGGKRGAHAPGVRTDPEEAARYTTETRLDALAVAVGSRHAMTERTAVLDVGLIGRLAEAVDVPLVLHGSSGVSEALLAEAVAAGIRKVNIGTILGVVGTARLRSDLAADPAAVDPRRYGRGAREATRELVARLCALLGPPGPRRGVE